MKLLKLVVILLVLTGFGTSCKKVIKQETDDIVLFFAKTELSQKMAIEKFNDLDWSKARKISIVQGEQFGIICIPSKTISTKSLLFYKGPTETKYNWVNIINQVKKDKKISADVELTDINNTIINQFSIIDNKYVSASAVKNNSINSLRKTLSGDDPIMTGSGGDATVTGYLKNSLNGITFWRVYYFVTGITDMNLYATTVDFIQLDEFSGVGSAAVELPELPEIEAPGADSSRINPNGTKFLQSTFFWMVPGRGIKISMVYDITTLSLNSFDCSILGIGLFGINYKGVNTSYTLGNPNKNLYVEMKMEYVVPIISLVGDITIPIKWQVRVEDVNHGGERMFLY